MKVIALTSTYQASALREADAIVQKLAQVKLVSATGKLTVNLE
jgi:hypothetical protein